MYTLILITTLWLEKFGWAYNSQVQEYLSQGSADKCFTSYSEYKNIIAVFYFSVIPQ